MPIEIAELADIAAYEAELAKPGVLVLDFYSTQCPPCKVRLRVSNFVSITRGYLLTEKHT